MSGVVREGRKSFIDEAGKVALAAVQDAENRIVAFRYTVDMLRDRYRDPQPGLKEAESTIWGMLHAELAERYRRLFMWGLVDQDFLNDAKRLALRKYLREGVSIMGYLQIDGNPPRFTAVDEEEFRRELEAVRAELDPSEDD